MEQGPHGDHGRSPAPGRRGVILALLLLTAACVIVPIGLFTDSVYSPEVLAKIPKGSTKVLVRQILGPPDSEKDKGRFWFYFHWRDTIGVIGSPSGAVWGELEWLLVEFDAVGQVAFIERNKYGNCASNGICPDGAAHAELDRQVRGYVVKPAECGVYLYLERLPWPLNTGTVQFRIDARAVSTVNPQTYLFVPHPTGEVGVAAYDLKIAMRCEGGAKIYIRAIKKRDMSWETGEDLAPVSTVEGEKAIQARKLAMPD